VVDVKARFHDEDDDNKAMLFIRFGITPTAAVRPMRLVTEQIMMGLCNLEPPNRNVACAKLCLRQHCAQVEAFLVSRR
jgi:hypothetical protein